MPEKDYYKVLGVSPDASQDQIRKAYRKLAKKYHPDRAGGSKAAEEKFKEIGDAYAVLGDPEKRKQYDRLRQAGMRGGPGMEGFEDIFAHMGGGEPGGAGAAEMGGFGDLFSRIFGGGRAHTRQAVKQRGADLTLAIKVPFNTAAHGGVVDVKVPREKECPNCGGSGAAPGSGAETCPQCGGKGQVLSGQGAFSVARPCPSCFGRGKIIQNPCGRCRGSGTVEEASTVEVRIPAGIEGGQKMRLAGMGEPGVGGAPAGDLLLEVHVAPHPKFERKGRDIYSTAEIGMAEAALGTRTDVQTLQGEVTVTIPPGTQPGQKLRIPEHGLETSDGRRGDHYVQVKVRIPRDLSDRQKELLKQLQRSPAGAKS